MVLSPVLSKFPSSTKVDIPNLFGPSPAKDVLQNFKLTQDQKKIRVMFLGSGDIFRALIAGTSHHPEMALHLCLTDSSLSNVARNILLFSIVDKIGHDSSEEEVESLVSLLWEVWYGYSWSEETKQHFLSTMEELIKNNFPIIMDVLPQVTRINLEDIWIGWTHLLQHVQKSEKLPSPPSFQLNDHTAMGLESFPVWMRKNIVQEAESFYLDQYQPDDVCLNPTILDSSGNLLVDNGVLPFLSFLPFTYDEKKDLSTTGRFIIPFCKRRLRQMVCKFQERQSFTTFACVQGNPCDIPYQFDQFQVDCLGAEPYDVIDCSTLIDQVGLANMLNAGARRLSNRPESLLITRSSSFTSMAVNNAEELIESSLCAPLSMLPTLYGLRLDGSLTTEEHLMKSITAVMMWRRTPQFGNLGSANLFLSLQPYLHSLAELCYTRDGSSRSQEERLGLKYYSSTTWLYVVAYLKERLNAWFQDPNDSSLPPSILSSTRFRLTRRTSRILAERTCLLFSGNSDQTDPIFKANLLKMPTLQLFSVDIRPENLSSFKEQPLVYVVLYPNSPTDHSSQDVHQIDSVGLRFTRNADQLVLRVSFLLPSDHGLDDTHNGILLDSSTKERLIDLGPLNKMKRGHYLLRYPFMLPLVSSASIMQPSPSTGAERIENSDYVDPRITVKSVEETPDYYTVGIGLFVHGAIDGIASLGISAPILVAENVSSAYWIDIRFRRPLSLDHQTIRFPNPCYVESYGLDLSTRTISLKLRKTLMVIPIEDRMSETDLLREIEAEQDRELFLIFKKKLPRQAETAVVHYIDPEGFPVDEDGHVISYVDGSVLNQGVPDRPKFLGYGVWFADGHKENVSAPVKPFKGPHQPITAEAVAVTEFFKLAKKKRIRRVTVCTDNEAVYLFMTKTAPLYLENNWKKKQTSPYEIENKTAFRNLLFSMDGLDVKVVKVKAHTDVYGNNEADTLAKKGSSTCEMLSLHLHPDSEDTATFRTPSVMSSTGRTRTQSSMSFASGRSQSSNGSTTTSSVSRGHRSRPRGHHSQPRGSLSRSRGPQSRSQSSRNSRSRSRSRSPRTSRSRSPRTSRSRSPRSSRSRSPRTSHSRSRRSRSRRSRSFSPRQSGGSRY